MTHLDPLERALSPQVDAHGLKRLKARAEFLHVAKGRRWANPHFILQAAKKPSGKGMGNGRGEQASLCDPRLGFTVTKKVGNAPERNRIRRRLKGAMFDSAKALVGAGLVKPDYDYVIIARRSLISLPFDILLEALAVAFTGVHRAGSSAKATRNP